MPCQNFNKFAVYSHTHRDTIYVGAYVIYFCLFLSLFDCECLMSKPISKPIYVNLSGYSWIHD